MGVATPSAFAPDEGAREAIIVAIDADTHGALALARALRGRVRWLKVGLTLFCSSGPAIVLRMREIGFDVFLDLKLHDIPHQVEGAVGEVAVLGARMITVHASGGRAMMEAAVRGACSHGGECGPDSPDVVAVTVLTSFGADALTEIGVAAPISAHVESLTRLARSSGVQGVVCSPWEASSARSILGPEALVITPGVRSVGADAGDQLRIATPAAAYRAGASHLVIGRPITAAADPVAAVERIVEELHQAGEVNGDS